MKSKTTIQTAGTPPVACNDLLGQRELLGFEFITNAQEERKSRLLIRHCHWLRHSQGRLKLSRYESDFLYECSQIGQMGLYKAHYAIAAGSPVAEIHWSATI